MTSNLTVGTDFLNAWARSDVATFTSLLAPDLVFSSPRVRLDDRDAAVGAMAGFAEVVESVNIIAAAETADAGVLVLYDMHTKPFGTIRALDFYRLKDGLIVELQVLFDTAVLAQTA